MSVCVLAVSRSYTFVHLQNEKIRLTLGADKWQREVENLLQYLFHQKGMNPLSSYY